MPITIFFLRPALLSASAGASESEGEEMESQVTLPQDLPGRGNIKQQQSAVKLTEVSVTRASALHGFKDGGF